MTRAGHRLARVSLMARLTMLPVGVGTVTRVVQDVGSTDEAGSISGWLLTGLAFVGGLVVGVAICLLGRRPPAPQIPAPLTSDAQPAAAVEGLIAVADLSDSPVVLAQVERSLRQLGIEHVLVTQGDLFDTEVHHAVGWQDTPTPGVHHRVAKVVRTGWRTGPEVIRPADVELYRPEGQVNR